MSDPNHLPEGRRVPFHEVAVGKDFFWRGDWWKKEQAPHEGFTTAYVAAQRSTNHNRLVGLPDTEEVQIVTVH